jgi:hypothetical protein
LNLKEFANIEFKENLSNVPKGLFEPTSFVEFDGLGMDCRYAGYMIEAACLH